MRTLAAILALGACWMPNLAAAAPASTPAALHPAPPERGAGPELRSVGAPGLGSLADALFTSFAASHPEFRKGALWDYRSEARAIGALMFEQADFALVLRDFDRNELAPYEHQFRGDMMKAPVLVPVAMRGAQTVSIACNRRPGAPLEGSLLAFLDYALGPDGQSAIAALPGFSSLPREQAASQRAALAFPVAALDPALPEYRPGAAQSGAIRSVGSDGMKSLMDRWMQEFTHLQPGVRRGEIWEHLGTLNGFHALMNGLADIAPMGRELWPQERRAYAEVTGIDQPVEIRVARGGFNTPQRTTAQVIFVHPGNPLRSISVPQLAALLRRDPAITRWGQLGLTGEWADRPIHVYMPPAITPNAMSMQAMVLHGGAWSAAAREGSIEQTAQAIAGDPAAIGFGGLEEGAPGLGILAVAPAQGAPAVTANYDTAASGAYPLTRYMYIRLTRRPGQPLAPHVREFLRFVLSRQGQAPVRYSGYFPLTAREITAELAKLDAID